MSTAAYWTEHWGRGDAGVARRFNALAPDDARAALASLGIPAAHVVDYGSWENRVYACSVDEPPHWLGTNNVTVKFYRAGRWSSAAVEEELMFVTELADAGIAVVRPIAGPGGSAVFAHDGVCFGLVETVVVPEKGSRISAIPPRTRCARSVSWLPAPMTSAPDGLMPMGPRPISARRFSAPLRSWSRVSC